ncbi:MAG: lantibiotic dehydratase [Nannocystaceae bacterium]
MSDRWEDLVVLRTPLLPFDDFLEWSRHAQGESDEGARERLRQELARIIERPEVREALFVASPSLVQSLEVWRADPHSKQGEQLERALVRYLSRMTARPTPFGLCSGVSVGTLGPKTALRLAPRRDHRRAVDLDGAAMERLRSASETQGTIGPNTRVRVSSTVLSHDGRLRYVEAHTSHGRSHFQLAEIESSPYIEWVLERARSVARARDLVDVLRERDPEIDADEAMEFVADLVEHQLLRRADGLRATGPSALHGIIEDLGGDGEPRRTLLRVREQIEQLPQFPFDAAIPRYRAMNDALAELVDSPSPAGALKIDLHKPLVEGTLDASVRDELVEAARLLARAADDPADPLWRFRADFRQRYQERWVPLLQALDPDVGVGFDLWGLTASLRVPLLDGLPFVATGSESIVWHPRKHGWLTERMLELARRGGGELVMSDADFEAIALRAEPALPPAYHLIASLLPPGMPGQATLWLRSGGGPSGVNLLGRFCHGSSDLEQGVRRHLERERELYAPAVVAEIAHLPDGRLLNVVGRPVLRDYEIPVLGDSGAPAPRQIPLDDLWLRLDGDRVVLASRRLGTEVIPRLTSAHNHWSARNVGVYSFLCALQGQGMSTAFGWDWGPLADLPALPRVRWRRIIVSPARWRIARSELVSTASSASRRATAVAALRQRHALPRFVLLVQGDQELLVDLDNPLSVDSMLHAVANGEPSALLRELLQHGNLPVVGPEGGFVHELIIPVVGTLEPRAAVDTSRIGEDQGPRVFPPHAEWDTWRLYAAPALVERTLVEDLLPWLEQRAPADGDLEWFFLRHGDPSWHLCLRVRGSDPRAVQTLRSELAARLHALVATGRSWRVRSDTYVREIERYGGPRGIAACERVFVADSRWCSVALSVVDRAQDEGLRWKIALWSIARMLEALGLDEAERLQLVQSLRHNYGEELGANAGPLKHALGRRYRELRPEVEATVALESERIPLELREASARFAARVEPEISTLRSLEREGELPESLSTIVRSVLHMRLNRLMIEHARKQELVLHDLLARALRSRRARRRESARD